VTAGAFETKHPHGMAVDACRQIGEDQAVAGPIRWWWGIGSAGRSGPAQVAWRSIDTSARCRDVVKGGENRAVGGNPKDS